MTSTYLTWGDIPSEDREMVLVESLSAGDWIIVDGKFTRIESIRMDYADNFHVNAAGSRVYSLGTPFVRSTNPGKLIAAANGLLGGTHGV